MTKSVGILISVAVLVYSVHSVATFVQPNASSPTADLRDDLASPARWCTLAEQHAEEGRIERARVCFHRALELAPHLPSIWMRAANFHFTLGESQEYLALTSRVLGAVPDYDGAIFGYYGRLELRPFRVMTALAPSKRATSAYFGHLLGNNRSPSDAAAAWPILHKMGYADDRIAANYVGFLVGKGLAERAATVWADYLGDRRGDYLRPNRLYNGSFENEPTGAMLDWRIEPHAAVETTREKDKTTGRYALRLQFRGSENVSYRQTTQSAVVVPGNYILQARIRTQNITTNEGIHVHVTGPGLDIRTESISGTTPWTRVELAFTSAVPLISVRVCRDPSSKFDNKINGTAWIDDVSLVRR